MKEVNAEGSMMKPSSTEIKGLIVRKPFIDLILSGRKRYEIRKTSTRFRGKIALVWRGKAYGTVWLTNVLQKPVNELNFLEDAEKWFLRRYSKGLTHLFLWELKDPVKFIEPVPIFRRGAQTWIRLTEEEKKRILEAEERATKGSR